MNAIDLLDMQHGDVETLLERLAEGQAGREARRTLFNRVADALAVHAAIEEMHFYPAVKERRTEDILLESLEEHLAIKRLLRDLLLLDVGDPTFAAKCKVLKEEVEHHVKDEREELFPRVRRLFDEDELEAIGQLMTSTMVELEKGEPRKEVLGQTVTAMPLEGQYVGAHGGNFLSRVFPRVAKLTALPMQVIGVLRQGAQRIRGLRPRRTREA